MGKVITKGTEVLIFRYLKQFGPIQNEENYIIGTVQSVKVVDNVSKNGISSVPVYEVLGNDGKIYTGAYGAGLVGNSFFRTREDHIENLKRKIARNDESILKLQKKNEVHNKLISLLEKELEEIYAVSCDRQFVVDSELTEEFREVSQNSEIREYDEETLEKVNINNNVLDRYILKKTKKLNKK